MIPTKDSPSSPLMTIRRGTHANPTSGAKLPAIDAKAARKPETITTFLTPIPLIRKPMGIAKKIPVNVNTDMSHAAVAAETDSNSISWIMIVGILYIMSVIQNATKKKHRDTINQF